MPDTPATVTPTLPAVPLPHVPMHAADVPDVQLLVEHIARASTTVTVASARAKLTPTRLTLALTDATLYGLAAVSTGPAERQRRFVSAS